MERDAELISRIERLYEKRDTITTSAQKNSWQLDQLRKKAKETFGTSNLKKLEKKLKKTKTDRDTHRDTLQAVADRLEDELEAIESKVNAR